MMLDQVPFIHRVPRMKAFATGLIVQGGREHRLDRATVYQAKNHGRDYPDSWCWIHANAFREDSQLAFEVAWLDCDSGAATILRVVRPTGVQVLTSWQGDRFECQQQDGTYSVTAESANGELQIEARALHRENVVFEFPSPDGATLVNDESLLGELQLTINGKEYSTNMAALGRAHKASRR